MAVTRREFLSLAAITSLVGVAACYAAPTIQDASAASGDAAVFEQIANDRFPGTIEVSTVSTAPIARNNASSFWYYNQLNNNERRIYEAYLSFGCHADCPKLRATISFDGPCSSDEIYTMKRRACTAVIEDHPELFLLKTALWFTDYFSIQADRYDTSVSALVLAFDYEKETLDSAVRMVREVDAAVEAFLRGIDRNQHPAVVALQLHDALMQLATYDYDIIGDASYNRNRQMYDIFIRDGYGTPHTAVCQGYALAYQYLLQMCGIEAVFIGGSSYTQSDYPDNRHAWVAMQIEGDWYESDPTWDDINYDSVLATIEKYYASGDYTNAQFFESLLNGIFGDRYTHVYHMKTSDQMLYNASWCWEFDPTYTGYYSNGSYASVTFEWEDTHVRDNVGPGYDLTYPIAYGGVYTYYHVRDEMIGW